MVDKLIIYLIKLMEKSSQMLKQQTTKKGSSGAKQNDIS